MTGAVGGWLPDRAPEDPPPDRKEAEVRRMLDVPHPPVPADLAERAMAQGRHLVHRRRVLHLALWALLLAAVAAAVWASARWPSPPPLGGTPPPASW